MKASRALTVIVSALGLLALAPSESYADPWRLLSQAKKEEPGLARFSAERGATFYRATHKGGKQGTASCTACHGSSPQEKGRTRAGKDIEPMAVSKTPARYTDREDVEKWFTRNCNDVLGRSCTAKEKGDFITYMLGQ